MTLRTLAHIANLVSWILVILALTRKAQTHRPATKLSDGRVEFPPAMFSLWLWLFIALPSAWAAILALRRHVGTPWELLSAAVVVLIAISHLWEFPGTLVVTRGGLEQVHWIWLNRRIRWSDIVEIKTVINRPTVTIKGRDGTTVVYSAELPDRPRFLLELKRHCGENLPPGFPNEPAQQS